MTASAVRRWRSGLAALAVTVVTAVLVVLDVTDDDVRAWWTQHALTCSAVTGLLVLLVTVLVVDQVRDLRQARSRARATAAQAAIMLGQAHRSSRAVDAALEGGDGGDAGDDVRNYLMMLLVGGPVLIDSARTRTFLEEAQRLGAQLNRLLTEAPPDARSQLAAATDRLEVVARPLIDVLHPAERAAATADG